MASPPTVRLIHVNVRARRPAYLGTRALEKARLKRQWPLAGGRECATSIDASARLKKMKFALPECGHARTVHLSDDHDRR